MNEPAALLRRSSLIGLPLATWAEQFRRGSLSLRGRLGTERFDLGGWQLCCGPGEVGIEADFTGGAHPCLLRAKLVGPLVLEGGDGSSHRGRSLLLEHGGIFVDGEEVEVLGERVGAGRLLAALVRRLSDVAAVARAEPDGDVFLELGHGIQVRVTDGVLLTARAATRGPPDALELSAPLDIGFGGDGIRLSHREAQWLTRLARVRIGRATLHPDGSVALEGRGRRGLDLAVRSGLRTASAGLSRIVRRDDAFSKIRRFLANTPRRD